MNIYIAICENYFTTTHIGICSAWSFPQWFSQRFEPLLSDTIPNINRESITNIDMAAGNEFKRFLQSINLAEEYLDKFIKTGYNDIALLKSLESQEQQDMFDLTGLIDKTWPSFEV